MAWPSHAPGPARPEPRKISGAAQTDSESGGREREASSRHGFTDFRRRSPSAQSRARLSDVLGRTPRACCDLDERVEGDVKSCHARRRPGSCGRSPGSARRMPLRDARRPRRSERVAPLEGLVLRRLLLGHGTSPLPQSGAPAVGRPGDGCACLPGATCAASAHRRLRPCLTGRCACHRRPCRRTALLIPGRRGSPSRGASRWP